MTRAFAALAAILVISQAGCTSMCQSPWDYCNAVLDGSGTPNCNFGARYNSSFAPMNGTPPTTAVAPMKINPIHPGLSAQQTTAPNTAMMTLKTSMAGRVALAFAQFTRNRPGFDAIVPRAPINSGSAAAGGASGRFGNFSDGGCDPVSCASISLAALV